MSLHVFATIVTPFGAAANNRGETEGNVTTLQKLIWHGAVHTTVSAESIRFALRRRLVPVESAGANRQWDEDKRANTWQDWSFKGWDKSSGKTFIDDDLLGYMTAEAASEEGESGSANVRRAVLEVTRAVSLTPWSGEVTFNAASPGATPSAQKAGANPVPYGAELHATRYQYGFALTPERLRDPSRTVAAIQSLCELGPVAGNHGRFLFDFSPESIVLRITPDPAPRLLYCFDTSDHGRTVGASALVRRVEQGDISAKELILGGEFHNSTDAGTLRQAGAFVGSQPGVKAACEEAIRRIRTELKLKG